MTECKTCSNCPCMFKSIWLNYGLNISLNFEDIFLKFIDDTDWTYSFMEPTINSISSWTSLLAMSVYNADAWWWKGNIIDPGSKTTNYYVFVLDF